MGQRHWGVEKVTLKIPYIIDIELKNRAAKDVPVHAFSKSSGKCIDVQGYSEDDSGSIIQYSLHGENNQRWVFAPAGSGFYYIISLHSKKRLDVSGASKDDGAEIIQYHPHGGDSQKWYLRPVDNGYYHIVNKHSDKCLDVQGDSREDSAKIIQYWIHGGDNQKWRLLIAEPL